MIFETQSFINLLILSFFLTFKIKNISKYISLLNLNSKNLFKENLKKFYKYKNIFGHF